MINADYRQHMIPVDHAIAQLERFSDLARAELDRLPAELGPLDAEAWLRLDAELVELREKLDAAFSATRASASSTRSETPSPRSSQATTSSSRAFPPAKPLIIGVAGSIPIA
jgi:hypothetical protein